MIFVTGDTHRHVDIEKLKTFAKLHPEVTNKDYVIIAGDFGGVWSQKTLNEDLTPYEELPFNVLFVDGNHENFALLNSFPEDTWKGGKVHKIRTNIIHLMRGQVYEIEGKKIFTFGGATSIDKWKRQENISWWKEELPTLADLEEALKNLAKHNNKVDYIITHSCDEKALYYPPLFHRGCKYETYPENVMLSNFESIVDYKHWFFGHYHEDGRLNDKKTVLYQEIVKLI